MDSPMPRPPGLVLRNGSKSRSMSSGGMPGPRSLTVTSTSESTCRLRTIDDPIPRKAIAHRIESVQEEVEEDLLELDAVAEDLRQIGVELVQNGDAADHGVAVEQADHFLEDGVEVERPQVRGVFLHERPDPTDDLAGAGVIVGDVVEDVANLLQVRVGGVQEPGRGLGVAQDRGQWLVELVRQRRGHLAHRGDPPRVGQFVSESVGLLARHACGP